MAAALPPAALYIVEMGAMPGKRPAIVKRPYDRDIMPADIIKQHADMYIEAMDIMQVDKAGFDIVQPVKEPFRDGT